jgi:hypothetical protein
VFPTGRPLRYRARCPPLDTIVLPRCAGPRRLGLRDFLNEFVSATDLYAEQGFKRLSPTVVDEVVRILGYEVRALVQIGRIDVPYVLCVLQANDSLDFADDLLVCISSGPSNVEWSNMNPFFCWITSRGQVCSSSLAW